ncbi:type II toxin-antitoxin system VapC family toxin [Aliarcobacter vitoriensis]|uniref:VapC toxin family PIN domain ribonuclease n=1 Tax=Aliarcobacter vitoriensis TaxID=2011099 RepID=A0A366MRD3_9BACT|nr:type II toxin-antitoxin system VapC family toxin [Aliarcobacter vitoriensis]RBQ28049.1 VapC toxin family PIN domain ribonuclease [Aliarcobacter vitoriensis]
MRYLLDTNIISELISKQPNQNVVQFLSSIDKEDIYLSVITIGEIKSGIENLKNLDKKENLSKWLEQDLLIRFQNKILNIDTNIMLIWGEINHKLKNIGKPLPIMDSLIASICICHNITLVTRNEKDFQNIELTVINPFN